MSGTEVTYNGVKLTNVVTRGADQEFILDNSGTDLIGERVRLSFTSIVHSQELGTVLHGANAGFATGSNVTDMFRAIEERLSAQRAQFLMTVNGKVLYLISPAISPGFIGKKDTDVNNGPHTKNVRIESIAADQGFRISFTIEFMVSGCVTDGANVVINNRWSVTESRDGNFFTTRRISGHIRFSSAYYAGHAYLPWCIPGLEAGFKRENVEFETLPSGLEATYSITDRQVMTSAPWPATRIEGYFSWSTNMQGATWMHSAECTLHGSPEVSPTALFARAIQVVDSRINFIQDNNNKGAKLLRGLTYTERIGEENAVTVQFQVQFNPADSVTGLTESLGNVAQEQLGKRLALPPLLGQPYDPRESRTGNFWGYTNEGGERNPSILFMLHCYWQDPCQTTKSIFNYPVQTVPPIPQVDKRYNAQSQGYQVASLSPGNLGNYDANAITEGVYTVAEISSTFNVTMPRIMIPLAINPKRNTSGMAKTAVFATMGDRICTRTIRYSAERANLWPIAPKPIDSFRDANDIGYYLLDYWMEFPAVRLGVDGIRKIYSMQMVYVYGMDRSPTIVGSDLLRIGKLPFQSFEEGVPIDKIFDGDGLNR